MARTTDNTGREVESYTKQKYMYLLRSSEGGKLLLFSNIQAAVVFINGHGLFKEHPIAHYPTVVEQLRGQGQWNYYSSAIQLILYQVAVHGRVVNSRRRVAAVGP
jgi:hypothetical protein